MTYTNSDSLAKKCSFEDALDITGFGKYNVVMLLSCCLLIIAMYVDIFGFSVLMPAVACDMSLSTTQQGLLSAVPLIGVMVSSYCWGLCVDIVGRRTTLFLAMPVGSLFNLAASLAPNYASLAVLKFLSASFTSSSNAAVFVLMGESIPRKHRSRFMFLIAAATMVVQLVISLFALPIFQMSFRYTVPLINTEYRPWRLLMQVICLPGILGILIMLFLHESPKFLLSKNKEEEAINVLTSIYRSNSGLKKCTFPVNSVYLEETTVSYGDNISFLRKMWNQTVPLFKPPLLGNSLKIYYILLCAYMTSTGFTMWVPTMTNAYFNGDESKSGQTFCQVASTSASSSNSTSTDCDNVIENQTLYAVMVYSVSPAILSIGLSFIVGVLGKKMTTLLVFIVSAVAGILLLFVTIPYLSLVLFFIFLYVSIVLGNMNTYLVELNPTHLRGMATCLSVVVARGFGFISVQLIATLLADNCVPMISGYVVLVISGLIVALFLPSEANKEPNDLKEVIENDDIKTKV